MSPDYGTPYRGLVGSDLAVGRQLPDARHFHHLVLFLIGPYPPNGLLLPSRLSHWLSVPIQYYSPWPMFFRYCPLHFMERDEGVKCQLGLLSGSQICTFFTTAFAFLLLEELEKRKKQNIFTVSPIIYVEMNHFCHTIAAL